MSRRRNIRVSKGCCGRRLGASCFQFKDEDDVFAAIMLITAAMDADNSCFCITKAGTVALFLTRMESEAPKES